MIEALEKHFKQVDDKTIKPVRLEVAQMVDPSQVRDIVDRFWQTQDVRYHSSYQTGKMLAKSKELKLPTEILSLVGEAIPQSIKLNNLKLPLSSEKLQNHFVALSSLLKIIESDLNALFDAANGDLNKDPQALLAPQPVKQFRFDQIEILALLAGFITTKIYGEK